MHASPLKKSEVQRSNKQWRKSRNAREDKELFFPRVLFSESFLIPADRGGKFLFRIVQSGIPAVFPLDNRTADLQKVFPESRRAQSDRNASRRGQGLIRLDSFG